MGRSLKIVFNGHYSEVHEINVSIPKGSFHGSTFFLLYINDLLKNIFGSFVGIYAEDTTVCEYTSENLDVQSMAADLCFGLFEGELPGSHFPVPIQPKISHSACR